MINLTKNINLSVIGLGYVGLPLALEFAKKRKVIGYDINKKRIKELNSGIDKNCEFNKKNLQNSSQLDFTCNKKDLNSANCYIITVPTPTDSFKKPERSIKKSHNFYTQDLDYTQYGPTFTFQPNINRTSEIFVAWMAAQELLDKLDTHHCELVSGAILKNLTDSNTPFSFFNPKKIYSKHIG